MKRFFGSVAILFLLNACISKQTESLPISEEDVEKVLLDVHIAESAMSQLQNGSRKDSLAEKYYNQIAEIHHIDRETLDSCLAILQRNPEMASEIYGKISEDIDKQQLEGKFAQPSKD